MSDIVQRLQDTASKGVSVWGDLQMEAAGEIQILRAELAVVELAFERATSTDDKPAVGWVPGHKLAACVSSKMDMLHKLKAERERTRVLHTALSIVRNYPDFDNGGPLADMMDDVLAGRPSQMLQSLDMIREATQ